MKNALIALGLTLAVATPALADSSALDVVGAPSPYSTSSASGIDYTPTASIGGTVEGETRLRYGDGSPAVVPSRSSGVDYTPTASIGGSGSVEIGPRFGDGSPAVYN